MIRKPLLSTLIATTSIIFATDPARAEADPHVDSGKEEALGVLSGMAIGGLLGGPAFVIGAAAGAWAGESVAIRKNHHLLEEELARTQQQMTALMAAKTDLEQQQLALQQQLNQRQLLAARDVKPAVLGCCSLSEVVLHFRTNSAVLEPHYQEALLRFIETSKANPGRVVEILGYADQRGDDTNNLLLSQHRIETVLQALRSLGLAAATYETVANGELQVLATDSSIDSQFFDRRVVLRFKQVQPSLLGSNQ